MITNLPDVFAAHRRFLTRHDHAYRDSLEDASDFGLRYANSRPRFTPRTGELQKANESRVIRTRTLGTVRFRNRKPYAASIDQGARPHDIFPRDRARGRLIFFWPKVGKWIYARRVKHPGNKPYRFLHGATIAAGRFWFVDMSRRMFAASRLFGR